MDTLEAVEIKAFVLAKDCELSKKFYQDLGFTLKSDTDGVAYFCHNDCSFLVHNHYTKEYADNFTMHNLDFDNTRYL